MKLKFNKIFGKMDNVNDGQVQDDTKATTEETLKEPLITDENNAMDIETESTNETAEAEKVADNSVTEVTKLQQQVADLNDKYLRLYSEFDNYRRRTAKEKIELSKTAGEDFVKAILPVIDDFERGLKAMENATDIEALKQGVDLIYNKFKGTMFSKGLEPMVAISEVFNVDLHEAITNIPAPSDDLKGKVVDELEKGYLLNGKVIRFAKVIVGN